MFEQELESTVYNCKVALVSFWNTDSGSAKVCNIQFKPVHFKFGKRYHLPQKCHDLEYIVYCASCSFGSDWNLGSF